MRAAAGLPWNDPVGLNILFSSSGLDMWLCSCVRVFWRCGFDVLWLSFWTFDVQLHVLRSTVHVSRLLLSFTPSSSSFLSSKEAVRWRLRLILLIMKVRPHIWVWRLTTTGAQFDSNNHIIILKKPILFQHASYLCRKSRVDEEKAAPLQTLVRFS